MIVKFFKPQTLKEAAALKKANPQAVFMGGGTWLNSSYSKFKPEAVISLAELGLNKIVQKDKMLKIGSGVTLQAMIAHQETPEILKTAAGHLANRNLRNMATIGGNLGAGASWFSLIPALLVLEAALTIHNDDKEQEMTLDEYLLKKRDDLIVQIKIPLNPQRKTKIFRYAKTARAVPILVAAGSYELKDHKMVKPLLAIGGIAEQVVLLKDLDLQKDQIAATITKQINPKSDFRASAEFRKYLAGVLGADCFEGAN